MHVSTQTRCCERSGHAAHGAGVLGKLLIGCDQQQTIGLGLGQQQAIKGITMQAGNCPNQNVVRLHRQLRQPASNRAWRSKGGSS